MTQPDDISVFDRSRVRNNRDRAAKGDPGHRFLADWAFTQLAERLDVVRRTFPKTLQIGCLTGIQPLDQARLGIEMLVRADLAAGPLYDTEGSRVQAAEDMLPFADASFDMVISPLCLHNVNDLPGALLQIRRVLKPDGLFIGALAGGETLHQLRHCLMDAEMRIRGGASPRVAPFADKPQMGALLQRAGFALPVVDSELVTVSYEHAFRLMQDLRMMGESNSVANRDKRFAGRALFMETARLYADTYAEPDGRIPATFEIIFLLGWAPHESQQKPLRPGSARTSLAEVLGTDEIPAGELTGEQIKA